MSDAEVAEQVLSEHERTVLRHLRRRGVDSTLSLYRQYKDRGSLENAVRRMAEKVAIARNRPTADIGERDLADVLADMTGMPVSQVLSAGLGRMSGAAAPASTPPVTGAAAPSPSSPPALPAPARPADPDPQPADDSPPAGFKRFEPSTRRHGANTASADRRRRIVELLSEKPRSVKLLEHELGCAPHQVAHDLQVLKGEGKVEPTERSAHDWPGANRSAKASKLYRIPVAVEYGLDTGATPTQAVPIDDTSDSGASDEGANEEASSQPDCTGAVSEALNGKPIFTPEGLASLTPAGVELDDSDAARAARQAAPPPLTDDALDEQDRDRYVDLLFKLAEDNPEHPHLFDRLERVLHVRGVGPVEQAVRDRLDAGQ